MESRCRTARCITTMICNGAACSPKLSVLGRDLTARNLRTVAGRGNDGTRRNARDLLSPRSRILRASPRRVRCFFLFFFRCSILGQPRREVSIQLNTVGPTNRIVARICDPRSSSVFIGPGSLVLRRSAPTHDLIRDGSGWGQSLVRWCEDGALIALTDSFKL